MDQIGGKKLGPCPAGKVRSAVTNRCVKAVGKTAKKMALTSKQIGEGSFFRPLAPPQKRVITKPPSEAQLKARAAFAAAAKARSAAAKAKPSAAKAPKYTAADVGKVVGQTRNGRTLVVGRKVSASGKVSHGPVFAKAPAPTPRQAFLKSVQAGPCVGLSQAPCQARGLCKWTSPKGKKAGFCSKKSRMATKKLDQRVSKMMLA